jgi:hypothetical protein
MVLFIKKFNKYISKIRAFKGDKKEKTMSKRVRYNYGKMDISLCNVRMIEEMKIMTRTRRKMSYKKNKKFTKKKSYRQAHVGQKWNSSDESSESESNDLATIAIKGKSSSSKSLFPKLSKHTSHGKAKQEGKIQYSFLSYE